MCHVGTNGLDMAVKVGIQGATAVLGQPMPADVEYASPTLANVRQNITAVRPAPNLPYYIILIVECAYELVRVYKYELCVNTVHERYTKKQFTLLWLPRINSELVTQLCFRLPQLWLNKYPMH